MLAKFKDYVEKTHGGINAIIELQSKAWKERDEKTLKSLTAADSGNEWKMF